MFNSITGVVSGTRNEMVILRGAGGLEWEIATSSSTQSACITPSDNDTGEAPATSSKRRVRLLVHLYHREDRLCLYGFIDERERGLFLQLIKVPGIGPRQALRILSGMPPPLLLAALREGDHQALSSIRGLGSKTAQKLVLALRGSVDLTVDTNNQIPDSDIVAALIDMGYDRQRSRQVVEQLTPLLRAEGVAAERWEPELLKRAIVRLSEGSKR